jgi:hypothetical protein
VPIDPYRLSKISNNYGVSKESLRLFWLLWKLAYWVNMEEIQSVSADDSTNDRLNILTALTLWLCN